MWPRHGLDSIHMHCAYVVQLEEVMVRGGSYLGRRNAARQGCTSDHAVPDPVVSAPGLAKRPELAACLLGATRKWRLAT